MLPSTHFISAICVSLILILLKWQWWQITLFFTAAFFIDVDHYLYFIYKKHSWNLIKAYHYFIKFDKILKKHKIKVNILMPFHNIEFLFLILILLFISFNIFFPIFLGICLHYFLDFLALLKNKEKNYKRILSVTYYYVITRKREIKTKG